MGKDSRSKELTSVGQTAGSAYNNLYGSQTGLEGEFKPISQNMYQNYNNAANQNMQDYSNIMGNYQNFAANMSGPTGFSYQNVKATNPAEVAEAYGYLREAIPGYRNFAETGGYSPADIQELRARGISPIRSAYSNTMMELNRARALGGAGGAPNYIAAASKAQREVPGQMADAMTTVNAQLADAIRQGKIQGLAGLSGVGGTMGGLSAQEANRMLQAAMSNQGADLQAQQLSEQSRQAYRSAQLAALGGQASLYGTTPGMASTFGNQALNAYAQRAQLEQMRNQYGLGLLDTQIRAYGQETPTKPWWQQVLGAAGSVLPYVFNSGAGAAAGNIMGSYGANGMGGSQFTGYMNGMPTAPPGNMTNNPMTFGSAPNYGGSNFGDWNTQLTRDELNAMQNGGGGYGQYMGENPFGGGGSFEVPNPWTENPMWFRSGYSF